jgi:hypothetical protein
VPIVRREHRRKLGEPGEQVQHAEPADRAADEVVRQQRLERRQRMREVVLLPERGPRQDDQEQPDFDEERDVEQAAQQCYLPA